MTELSKKLVEVDQLLDAVRKTVEEAAIIPRTTTYVDVVVLAIISKGIAMSKAICRLVEAGFPEEAFGISRTLVELSFTIRWITNRDSDRRADRFVEYFQKDRESWFEKLQPKYFSTLGGGIGEGDRRDMLETAKKYKSPNDWTGLPDKTRGLAMELDTHEFAADGKAYSGELDYEVIYKVTSHFVHGTIVALTKHLPSNGVPLTKLQTDYASDEIRTAAALHIVAAYMNKVVISAFRSLGVELTKDLSDQFDKAMALYKYTK